MGFDHPLSSLEANRLDGKKWNRYRERLRKKISCKAVFVG
jgi:hypothetical protein